MKIRSIASAAALLLACGTSGALDFRAGTLRIDHPVARATVAGQQTSGAYMTLVNEGPADRLMSASSPIARVVELHEMSLEGDVMKMRRVDGIDLGGGTTVRLGPGGYHVMFIGLDGPLQDGSSFPMLLHFEKAGDVTIRVQVEAAATDPVPAR